MSDHVDAAYREERDRANRNMDAYLRASVKCGELYNEAKALQDELTEALRDAQQVRDGLKPVIAHRECVGTGCIMCGDRGTVSWMHALTDAENQARRGEAKLNALQEKYDALLSDWKEIGDEPAIPAG